MSVLPERRGTELGMCGGLWREVTDLSCAVRELKLRRERAVRLNRRCACGKCIRCLDDSRWERIFKQKFADPNYYTEAIPRYSSSLSEL